MQTYKIKRMSYKRINEWIKEIDHLLYYYKRKMTLDVCGLCLITNYKCNVCLWKIIENSHCSDFKRALGLTLNIIYARNKKKWHDIRIPMLRRWKKILQVEKDRRTEGGG